MKLYKVLYQNGQSALGIYDNPEHFKLDMFNGFKNTNEYIEVYKLSSLSGIIFTKDTKNISKNNNKMELELLKVDKINSLYDLNNLQFKLSSFYYNDTNNVFHNKLSLSRNLIDNWDYSIEKYSNNINPLDGFDNVIKNLAKFKKEDLIKLELNNDFVFTTKDSLSISLKALSSKYNDLSNIKVSSANDFNDFFSKFNSYNQEFLYNYPKERIFGTLNTEKTLDIRNISSLMNGKEYCIISNDKCLLNEGQKQTKLFDIIEDSLQSYKNFDFTIKDNIIENNFQNHINKMLIKSFIEENKNETYIDDTIKIYFDNTQTIPCSFDIISEPNTKIGIVEIDLNGFKIKDLNDNLVLENNVENLKDIIDINYGLHLKSKVLELSENEMEDYEFSEFYKKDYEKSLNEHFGL